MVDDQLSADLPSQCLTSAVGGGGTRDPVRGLKQ